MIVLNLQTFGSNFRKKEPKRSINLNLEGNMSKMYLIIYLVCLAASHSLNTVREQANTQSTEWTWMFISQSGEILFKLGFRKVAF